MLDSKKLEIRVQLIHGILDRSTGKGPADFTHQATAGYRSLGTLVLDCLSFIQNDPVEMNTMK